jgi:lysophospholipase L1-like esterase
MATMMRRRLLLMLVLAASPGASQGQGLDVKFAEQIAAFEQADRTSPPPARGILFIGSSIFRLWTTLPEQMAPLPVFNRGFGGSRTHEVLAYMDRIVLPYRPRVIVYYCGSNDINAHVTPAQIAANFRTFVERVRQAQPATRILFVSINKAPQKRDRWGEVDEANRLIRAYVAQVPGLRYVDVNPALSDAAGAPRLDLYLPDLLHFHPPAYVEFTRIIKPALIEEWQRAQ